MKILHTITTMDPRLGGVCQAVRTIVSSLNQLDIDNEIACLDGEDASFLKDEVIKIHALGPASGPWVYSKRFLPWLEDNLSRFDMVIVHGLWQYQSHAVAKAMRRLRKSVKAKGFLPKVCVMPHGMLDPYFQRAAGRKIKAIRNYVYWKFIENKVINESDGLLFTCEQEQRLARQPFAPYAPKREMVVGLGVDEPPRLTASVKNAIEQLNPSGQPYLLFLSRINEKKGVDLLLDAFGQIVSNGRTRHHMIVAGPGIDTPYGEQLVSLLNKNSKARESVSFPGMVTGDKKWASVYGCSAFILPSHQENFGIAVVEALACGKPVLISNQVNIWGEIAEAGCGIIAADTLQGTKELLEKWEKMPEADKLEMGRKARVLYERNYAVGQAAIILREALSSVK